jgi:hypothetical protein
MNLPTESLYESWRDLFFKNIDPSFLSDEIVEWCDDQLARWVGSYYAEERRPSGSEIVKFAWQINEKLAEMEINALSR